MFWAVVGATTTNQNTLQHYSATLHVDPVSPADIYLGFYMDGSSSNALQAVDIGASYKFGAFKLIVGYVVGGTDQTNSTVGGPVGGKLNNDGGNFVTLGNDNVGRIANGFYIGSAIAF